MKITKSETIRECEKIFIDTITAGLDQEALEKILFEKYKFTLQKDIEYKNGDLVVYDNTIAYKFDFEIKVPLSVVFNRQGDCLEISTGGQDVFEKEDEEIDEEASLYEEDTDVPPMASDKKGKVAQMASNIADMISEINQPKIDPSETKDEE